jgi:hypothetical protein
MIQKEWRALSVEVRVNNDLQRRMIGLEVTDWTVTDGVHI